MNEGGMTWMLACRWGRPPLPLQHSRAFKLTLCGCEKNAQVAQLHSSTLAGLKCTQCLRTCDRGLNCVCELKGWRRVG
jgi:hypothetical protein